MKKKKRTILFLDVRKQVIVTFAALAVLLSVGAGYCWEPDMHYGLVKWLAVKAGFSLDDAEIIAAGSESADESCVLSATAVVSAFVCIGRSSEASRHVQQHHFPSDGFVPSPRENREVRPGDLNTMNAGNRWVRQEIAVPGSINFPKTNLNHFGQSLHSLADSWSHQGIPDKPPFPCTDDLVWAHSNKRGGYSSHDADLTHKFVKDTVDTARAINHYLNEYLRNNPQLRAHPGVPWRELEGRVKIFAELKTALEKEKWFKENKDVPLDSYTTYPCFLRKTSLQEHDKICHPSEITSQSTGGSRPDSEVTNFFEAFLRIWIVEGKVDELIKRIVDTQTVTKALMGDGSHEITVKEHLWVRTLLLMWLVPDHGLVNELGHGMPFKAGFRILASETIQKAKLFGNLSDAIHFPGTSLPFLITSINDKSFVATFQFRHTPRDMLTLVASKRTGNWMIVGLSWLAL